jgi:hypothetical protein
MIDLKKIEAAASEDKELDTVTALRPITVLEMVSMIRERDAVLRQALEALECAKDGWMNSQAIAAIKGVLK